MKKPTWFTRLTGAVVTLLLLGLPQSCREKDAPGATSDGPSEIRYHQLILECTESATLRKGVAILDFRFDTYPGGVVGYASGQYLAFNTTNYTPIDAALQTASADIANRAAEVRTVPTLTDFVAGRLAKVPGYEAVKTLNLEAIWGILGGEKTLFAQLDAPAGGGGFDVQKFLVAFLATPAQAQGGNSVQAGGGYDHSSYINSPGPQPGSALPEYKFVNPVTPPQIPSNSAPVQRNARGETPAERAAREEAARAAAQAGRTNRGPRDVSDAFSGIFERLGNIGAAFSGGRSAGDPHVRTHDGRTYGFQTVGEFVATKGENLEIQARQEDAYQIGTATVNTGVAARLGGDEVCLLVNPAALNAPRLFVNKKETALSALASVALGNGNKLQLTAPEKLVFSNAQGEGVTMYWNTPYLDYAVRLGEARKGKVTGLLGNFDGEASNDFGLSNGTTPPAEATFKTIHTLFADSWRVSNQTSLFVYEAGKNTDSYTDRAFPRAFPVLDPAKFTWAEGVCRAAGVTRQPELGQCIFDVGITGDTRLAQSSVLNQREFPASADIGVFSNLKLDLKEGQSADPQTRNLLDLDQGTFYRFAEGAAVAYDVDLVFDYYTGPWFAGPRAVKNCGVSCGAYAIWPRIETQQWPFFASTLPRYTAIPVARWEEFGKAEDLRNAWTFEAGADEKTELITDLLDQNTGLPRRANLWSFKTQQGKKGLLRFTQVVVDKGAGTASFVFDVKIER